MGNGSQLLQLRGLQVVQVIQPLTQQPQVLLVLLLLKHKTVPQNTFTQKTPKVTSKPLPLRESSSKKRFRGKSGVVQCSTVQMQLKRPDMSLIFYYTLHLYRVKKKLLGAKPLFCVIRTCVKCTPPFLKQPKFLFSLIVQQRQQTFSVFILNCSVFKLKYNKQDGYVQALQKAIYKFSSSLSVHGSLPSHLLKLTYQTLCQRRSCSSVLNFFLVCFFPSRCPEQKAEREIKNLSILII